MVHLITLPIAVHCPMFRWELDLFWYCHQRVYGPSAASLNAHAVIIKRNDASAPKIDHLQWPLTIPHTMCEAYFDVPALHDDLAGLPTPGLVVPLNIQIGLSQVLDRFADDQILEVTDCDMLHFRPSRVNQVGEHELHVSTVYENWHLLSLTEHRHVIEPYFENHGAYYNGGFVPIIGRADTLRRILPEWIAVHIDILKRPYKLDFHWWAGMYALQAACEKAKVYMVAQDYCYVPGANQLLSNHYIGHYCIDKVFDKRTFPQVDLSKFELTNPYFHLVKEWLEQYQP